MGAREVMKEINRWQKLILALVIPLLAAPLPIVINTSEGKCGYCLIIIALYWILEIVPLAVTSLLPVVLFPAFGIMTAKEVSVSYFKETLMLFLGSLIVAVAVEKWNLHKRLALWTLVRVGPHPRWLLLGVMLPTWFLSMWMSNTATTAMMMPIVAAILEQIKECQKEDSVIEDGQLLEAEEGVPLSETSSEKKQLENEIEKKTNADQNFEVKSSFTSRRQSELEQKFLFFAKTFSLATAYSANVGGIATLTGTPPNIIFKGIADSIYRVAKVENPVNFANWLALGVPLSTLLLVLLWVWMQLFMEGVRCLTFWRRESTNYERVKVVLRQEYKKLGHMSFAEISVALVFSLMAMLWITRKPGFIPGWGDLFDGMTGDSTPAILAAVLLFLLPSCPPSWLRCCRPSQVSVENEKGHNVVDDNDDDKKKGECLNYEPLLDWTTVNNRLAWSVLLLMGGGFALADGCEQSGLAAWVSDNFSSLDYLPTWAIILLLTVIVALATEVTSNAATTSIFVPIVGFTAIGMGVHPLMFMIPCTIATSLAFLLPAATPPNAIVFSVGYLRIKDMIKCGIIMNVLSVLCLNLMMNTWAVPVYDLNVIDDALNATNFNMTAFMTKDKSC